MSHNIIISKILNCSYGYATLKLLYHGKMRENVVDVIEILIVMPLLILQNPQYITTTIAVVDRNLKFKS
jgi:hypothetical protein